jgi:hypothetical protein
MVDNLQVELAPFGIRTLMVEPGFTKTNLPNTIISASKPPDAPGMLAAYDEAGQRAAAGTWLGATLGRERSDPARVAELLVDVVRGEGVAKGRPFPPRLAMGSDAVELMEGKARNTLRVLEAWRKEACATDFDGFETVEGAQGGYVVPPVDV